MHRVAHRHHLPHERGKRFTEKTIGWQKDERLSQMEQFELELEMENKVSIEKQIKRMNGVGQKVCHQKPWAEGMTYLMQLPDFGVLTAMTVLSAIGDSQRFETPKHLTSDSGRTPGLDQSGTKLRGKGIPKEGRRELRWALVEAAQQAVKSDPGWKMRFETLQRRMHRHQAIVAIARPLLEWVWYVLTRRQPDRLQVFDLVLADG